MDYLNALHHILSLTDYERVGTITSVPRTDLRRTELLLENLGSPHLAQPTIHVAGTKGKGSTAAMITSILSSGDCRVGLYTSPHLHSFRERIRINNCVVSEIEFAALVESIWPILNKIANNHNVGAITTFELLTAMAFKYFRQREVDFQVIEVGLGGRLDSTNVVIPKVCGITSISLDHTAILGDTIGLIAQEKAGIIKPGAKVVTSPQTPEALSVIRQACKTNGVELTIVGEHISWQKGKHDLYGQDFRIFSPTNEYSLRTPLLGEHQIENAATAFGVVEAIADHGFTISKDSIVKGLQLVQWPGRLEIISYQPLIAVDGAHNTYSLERLRAALKDYLNTSKVVIVVGVNNDKNLPEMVKEMANISSDVIITRSRHPKASTIEAMSSAFSRVGVRAAGNESVDKAIEEAVEIAGSGGLVLVTGSLFLVAEAKEAVQGILPEMYPTSDMTYIKP